MWRRLGLSSRVREAGCVGEWGRAAGLDVIGQHSAHGVGANGGCPVKRPNWRHQATMGRGPHEGVRASVGESPGDQG